MIYSNLKERTKQLETEIQSLQQKLLHFPPGKIICAKNEKRTKWYHSNEKRRTYIPKKNRAFAEQLAVKKYLTLQLKELEQEKLATDLYLRHFPSSQPQSQQLLTSPGYQELLSPYFSPKEEHIAAWIHTPYEKCPKKPEGLVHKTISGKYVRSKSESIIDMLLYTNHIPFKYECALSLNGITFYPDFTIMHPKTGQIIYWEHFGLIEQPYYFQKAQSKLQLYISNGIIPTIQLITTYETESHPLSPEYVQKMIQHYFV